ncbi:unnamed protein product [Rotaria magnacalcarata]|nr:unnamed protein product [Rotaria magnacalcarata]CAF4144603.1 unnamed protein product [Rotaria magnacalcarata]CAF4304342.1 unnamed protein product [Rotaria magnacalcarata]CAF4312821.1 unnamed protein product [Rotaria magnacalcarata]CAF4721600.1 unnamed protein product [Rotaria magnacalcarata]
MNNIIATSAATENEPGAFGQMPSLLFKAFGSSTQINMNVNEIIANSAAQILERTVGIKSVVHPNQHVNKSQSSDVMFSIAMHIAVAMQLNDNLFPALDNLHIAIKQCEESARIYEMARGLARVNIPETLGNEFSAYADQVSTGIRRLKTCAEFLFELPINDTPVGTLICTPQGVGKYLVES